MSPHASYVAAVTTSIALLVSGCSGQAGPDADRSTPAPSPAASSQCAVLAREPGVPAHELTEALPIRGIDNSFAQRELVVEAGGGPCAEDPAEAVFDECHLVSGLHELVSETRLWRPAEQFAEQEIAAGAKRIFSEDMTGYTVDGEVFHWRAVAVDYADPAGARTSPAWGQINMCAALETDVALSGTVSLSEGTEPFLMAKLDGPTLYLVETWTTTDPSGPAPIDDTATGLPPAAAVRMIMEWLVDHADSV